MNRTSVWMSLSILLLGCSLSVFAQQSAANAQTITLKAYVPFQFVVGHQTLPAGTYRIQRLMGRPAEADEVGMIVLRCPDARVYKAVVTNLLEQSLDSQNSAQLVFVLHAGQRYLSEVHIGGEKGHEIPNAARESELATGAAPREEIALAELR